MRSGNYRYAEELTEYDVARLSKSGRHSVGGAPGLALYIAGAKGRSWNIRVKTRGRSFMVGLGSASLLSLEDARSLAICVRLLVADGVHPKVAALEIKEGIAAEAVCKACGLPLGLSPSGQLKRVPFCDLVCRHKFIYEASPKAERACVGCGLLFYGLAQKKFCSGGCRSKYLYRQCGKSSFSKNKTFVCIGCGDEVTRRVRGGKSDAGIYCSRECYFRLIGGDREARQREQKAQAALRVAAREYKKCEKERAAQELEKTPRLTCLVCRNLFDGHGCRRTCSEECKSIQVRSVKSAWKGTDAYRDSRRRVKRKERKKAKETINDRYVAAVISKAMGLPQYGPSKFPRELLEAKRAEIRLKRLIKEKSE